MRYLSIVLLIITLYSCAPSKPIVKMDYPTPFEFVLIDSLPGTKNELYVKAHEWISKSFGSAKAVIDMQDKEAGKLIGKAQYDGVNMGAGLATTLLSQSKVTYIISIDVKDNRYRCIISDFYHTGASYTGRYGVSHATSYGDLQRDKIEYKSPTTYKMVEDKKYYAVKNQAMIYSTNLLKSFKERMRKTDKDF